MTRFRAVAAALFSILLALLAASSAYAEPTLHVAQSEAKAGQIVHFTISDAERGERYVLQIGEEEVAREKARGRHGLTGEFAMPDLGDVTRVVMLEAGTSGHGHEDDDDENEDGSTLTHALLYIASAAPTQHVGVPPAVAPGASPSEAAPTLPTLTTPTPASEPPVGAPGRKRSSHRKRGVPKRAQPKSDEKRSAHLRTKLESRQRNRSVLRHVLSSGGAAGPLPTDGSTEGSENTARATPRATITPSSQVVDAGNSGVSIALLVPALLALAALALATVAVLRRRRDPRPPGDA